MPNLFDLGITDTDNDDGDGPVVLLACDCEAVGWDTDTFIDFVWYPCPRHNGIAKYQATCDETPYSSPVNNERISTDVIITPMPDHRPIKNEYSSICMICHEDFTPENPCWNDDGSWLDNDELHLNGECKACANKRTA